MKKGEGAYKAITGYDFNKSYDKVKLALDYTTGEGERKLLQDKLKMARRVDLMKKYPQKANESDAAYAARISKL